MLRFIWVLLVVLSVSIYVLLDSKALEFNDGLEIKQTLLDGSGTERGKTMGMDTGLTRRDRSAPAFHPERLKDYFNNLVSKFNK